MFEIISIDIKAKKPLTLYKGKIDGVVQVAAATKDVSASLGVNSAKIRNLIHRREFGKLCSIASLKGWLQGQGLLKENQRKFSFAKQDLLIKILRVYLDAEIVAQFVSQLREHVTVDEEIHAGNGGGDNDIPDEMPSSVQSKKESPDRGENDADLDSNQSDSVCLSKRLFHSPVCQDEDEDEVNCDPAAGDDNDLDEVAPASEMPLEQQSDSSYNSSSSSSEDSESESKSSSSANSSDVAEEHVPCGPTGTPQWVFTKPNHSIQFGRADYSKSYALKPYDLDENPLLKRELKRWRKWWVADHNRERSNKPVKEATMEKRRERILCFFGFLNLYKCVPETEKFTLSLLLNHRLVKAFLEYMKEVRQNSDGTIGEFLTAAISVCKWLYRKEPKPAGGVKEISIVRRYMDMRNKFQNNADLERKSNDEAELKEQNKWISWGDFHAMVGDLREQWEAQSQTQGPTYEKAVQLRDLLILGYYTIIPARGSEVRLLQYLSEEQINARKRNLTVKKFVAAEGLNLITYSNGAWKIYLTCYKNFRHHGVDVTELPDPSSRWWTDLLRLFLEDYRHMLMRKDNPHNFVFPTKTGAVFEGSYFSDTISSLIQKNTGIKVATNTLRSSFLTWFYSTPDSNDAAACQSVANVMLNSVREHQKTYDRRTTSERKKRGLDLISKISATNRSSEAAAATGLVPEPRIKSSKVDAGEAEPASNRGMVKYRQASREVVEFCHQAYAVIRREPGRLLLAKMERSPRSNAPVYFIPLRAIYEWQKESECLRLEGEWDVRETQFTLH